MLHSPLLQIIQSLGKRERTELQRWVASPLVNRRPEVTRLCQYCCQALSTGHEADTEALHRNEAYQQVFKSLTSASRVTENSKASRRAEPLSPKEDAVLRYTMSFLFTAVKQWLAYREWSKDDTATGIMLCKSLRQRGLNAVFEKEFKALQDTASQVRASADFSLTQYQIEFERFEFNIGKGQPDPVQLRKVSDSFGALVANNALRHGCAALNTPGFNVETIDYLPETLARIAAGHYQELPSIQVYYRSFRLMQAKEETDYEQLKSLLFAYSHLFPVDEIRDPWLIALNFCIFRLNSGDTQWGREAFELYKTGLKGGYVLEAGTMPRYMYQNIMLLAVRCGEWDWARQFLDDYRKALLPVDRHNTFTFNLALWNFERKNYAEAQEILLNVEFRHLYYNLDARRMMVRMYYDQGAYLALDSLLHSFRTYLLRHRNIGYHFSIYANYIRAVRQILRLKPNDKQAREALRQKIKAEKHVAEREWLLAILGGGG